MERALRSHQEPAEQSPQTLEDEEPLNRSPPYVELEVPGQQKSENASAWQRERPTA